MTTPGALELTVTQQSPVTLDAALHCDAGELLALVGPSGAGKTTLLRMIAGLARPRSGSIRCNDELWFDSSRGLHLPPQQRKVGFVFQQYALFPHCLLYTSPSPRDS